MDINGGWDKKNMFDNALSFEKLRICPWYSLTMRLWLSNWLLLLRYSCILRFCGTSRCQACTFCRLNSTATAACSSTQHTKQKFLLQPSRNCRRKLAWNCPALRGTSDMERQKANHELLKHWGTQSKPAAQVHTGLTRNIPTVCILFLGASSGEAASFVLLRALAIAFLWKRIVALIHQTNFHAGPEVYYKQLLSCIFFPWFLGFTLISTSHKRANSRVPQNPSPSWTCFFFH